MGTHPCPYGCGEAGDHRCPAIGGHISYVTYDWWAGKRDQEAAQKADLDFATIQATLKRLRETGQWT